MMELERDNKESHEEGEGLLQSLREVETTGNRNSEDHSGQWQHSLWLRRRLVRCGFT
jgi:hypothetical protein